MTHESDGWKAAAYDRIAKILETHLGQPYWKKYRDLEDAVKALLPPHEEPPKS